MEKLKPCPFCGGEAEINKKPLWRGNRGYKGCYEFVAVCKKCGCKVDHIKNDSIYRSEEEAQENVIKVWNKRVLGTGCLKLEEVIKKFEQEIGEFEEFKKIHAVTHEDYAYIEKKRQLTEWLKELKAVHDEIDDANEISIGYLRKKMSGK